RFNDPLKDSDSLDWKADFKTPSGVGLFIGGPGPSCFVLLFFGGADYDDGFACASRPRRRKTKQQNRERCGPSYKQANPTGFSDANLERNLYGLAGNVGNDKCFNAGTAVGYPRVPSTPFFHPSLRDLPYRHPHPALKRWAIVACPYG